jgi:hypothetical protein
METGGRNFILINAYMPREGPEEITDEFCLQLSKIEYMITQNADCHIILCGDLNIDFSRNWVHTGLLSSFCEKLDICAIVKHCMCTIDYTYQFDFERFNVLDHFLTSSTLFDVAILSATVWHDGDNLSDHHPICLAVRLDLPVLNAVDKIFREKVSWSKANEDNLSCYKQTLSELLAGINIPAAALDCRDVICTDFSHCFALNVYSRDLIDACLAAGNATLPRTQHTNSRRVPGWNEFVEPLRQKSILWHKIWCESGRSRSGIVADIMRKTRAAYHHAVRRVQSEEHKIVKQRFADSIIGNRCRDFWSEVRKINGKNNTFANVVEGISNAHGIANMFAANYQDLYNSVSYDYTEMAEIKHDLFSSIAVHNNNDIIQISVEDVQVAVNKLKYNKNDGFHDLSTNHLKFAGNDLFWHLSQLLSGIVLHG